MSRFVRRHPARRHGAIWRLGVPTVEDARNKEPNSPQRQAKEQCRHEAANYHVEHNIPDFTVHPEPF
jgi:hypothetical protein